MSNPKGSVATLVTGKFNEVGVLKWFIIGIIAIALIQSIASKISSESDTSYQTVATITCSPNETLWKKSAGWCMSEELEPGTYKLKLQSANIQLAIWDDNHTRIISSQPIPPQGMSLESWSGQPYEKQFLDQAPVRKMRLVAAPIARIDHGEAFDPRKRSFVLDEPSRIGISINVVPSPGAFEGNQGEIVMRITQKAD
ncbi:MAG: hypothetical protein A2808_02095 [Candidatus Moranbacteria bacterium RIFCSPHIGHO2_01_FULL_55_24]|nr:MAG: hypothetical protein A2808_02095 [Candidatus Moranbacteria bacterium RIFCSPHIGHO2_01_FULL_55_24]